MSICTKAELGKVGETDRIDRKFHFGLASDVSLRLYISHQYGIQLNRSYTTRRGHHRGKLLCRWEFLIMHGEGQHG